MKTKAIIKRPVEKQLTPELLIQRAIDNKLPVETLEKLLSMRTELKNQWAKEQYFKALSQFQKKCPIITKEKKVEFISKNTGRKTKYNYATLDYIIMQVKDLLEEFGFSYMLKPKQNGDSMTAICETHHIDGWQEITEFTVEIDKTAFMLDTQKIASAFTYAKRYAFCGAFGIMTGDEDDDAQATEKNQEESQENNITESNIKEKKESIKQTTFEKFKNRQSEIHDDFNSKQAQGEIAKKSLQYTNMMTVEEKKYFSDILQAEKITKAEYETAMKGISIIQNRQNRGVQI